MSFIIIAVMMVCGAIYSQLNCSGVGGHLTFTVVKSIRRQLKGKEVLSVLLFASRTV